MTNENNGKVGDTGAVLLCAICRIRPQTEKYRPFCSKRCADVDLHRWLGGVYAIPAEADTEEDEMPSSGGRQESER
jgi:uncharacterized protein